MLDESLIEWTVSGKDWLRIHNKTWNGVATAAYIFDADNRILLIQRAAHDNMPNLWETPGGSVDKEDESILHGCAREVREEAGLTVRRVVRLVTEGSDDRPPWAILVSFTGKTVFCQFGFEVEVEQGPGEEVRLDPEEHQDYMWVTEEEVRSGVTMGEGRRFPLTCLMVRNRILEAYRLRRGGE